jgi:hypothetical protein
VLFFIEFQLDNKAIGMIMVVNKTKYKEIASIPKCISKTCILKCSSTNCNSLLLKLKIIKIIKDIIKFNIDVDKAIYLEYKADFFKRLDIINIPIIGMLIKEVNMNNFVHVSGFFK